MFILAENRRYDAMSFLNHQFAGVPHMDGMAAGSRTQTNCTISNRLQGRYATCCAGKPTSKLRSGWELASMRRGPTLTASRSQ